MKCVTKTLFAIVLPILLILSCGSGATNKDRLRVAVSIFPVYDITRTIAGGAADVDFIVPPGANPHTFEPVPSLVRRIAEADLFIGVHPEFDGWVREFLSPRATVRYLMDAGHEKDDNDHSDEANPHIWLSVTNGKRIAVAIAGFISEADSAGAAEYGDNLTRYTPVLDSLDRELRDLFVPVHGAAFIEHHPAWNYLAADYGLRIAGTIEQGHGHNPSVREFRDLIEAGRKAGVRVIVLGLNVESSTARSLAFETGAALLRLDTLGDPADPEKNTYVALMRFNARRLAEALAAFRDR
ncbi:zinc ABC transporter substrate-binding protein [bacterium]|nr:zinc ABC transporter substrate-binding protein [bacterium]